MAQCKVALWYPAKPRTDGIDGNWQLVPRSIPRAIELELEFSAERTGYLKQTPVSTSFFWQFPPKTKTSLLLDQGVLTNVYPQILISKCKHAVITLTYTEAMFDHKMEKGNRNVVNEKRLNGLIR